MRFRSDDIQKGIICYPNLDIKKNKDKNDKEKGKIIKKNCFNAWVFKCKSSKKQCTCTVSWHILLMYLTMYLNKADFGEVQNKFAKK